MLKEEGEAREEEEVTIIECLGVMAGVAVLVEMPEAVPLEVTSCAIALAAFEVLTPELERGLRRGSQRLPALSELMTLPSVPEALARPALAADDVLGSTEPILAASAD